MVSFIEPKDAFNLIMTIEVPVMVMLGGMGTVFGPLIGAVAYVVLKEFVWANFIDWHSGILGVIIVLLVCFRPGGAFTLHRATVARWRDRMAGEGEGLRVGLVWAGNPRFPGDRLRSPRLEGLRAVLDVPGVRLFGLQKGPGREDLERVALPASFTDLGREVADFADTAAIMANLDLVISSCTGPAHLAGALGVPLWVVLPFSPDWRWLLGRDDSPWYPTARLFRQDRVGDWTRVAARVAEALRGLMPSA